jgi:hypothetical protein
MPEPDRTACGDLEDPTKADEFGEWLRNDYAWGMKRVAFKDFHKTLSK